MKSVVFTILVALVGVGSVACAKESESADPRQSAQANPGQFVSVGNHQVSGAVRIEKRASGAYLVLAEDFRTSSGPDLRFVLRDSEGVASMVIVAPLSQFQGAQEYPLDLDDTELLPFDEVSVYCAKFHVDFGIAKIQ